MNVIGVIKGLLVGRFCWTTLIVSLLNQFTLGIALELWMSVAILRCSFLSFRGHILNSLSVELVLKEVILLLSNQRSRLILHLLCLRLVSN